VPASLERWSRLRGVLELLPPALALAASPGAALAEWRREGFARLGPIAGEPELTLLRQRAEALMLGTAPREGIFFQRDAPSYQALEYGKGWEGPTLAYRKLEKLERDPLFREAIENPLYAALARAALGPEVRLCRAALFTKPAGGGSELPWHQDGGPFWGLSRDPELQLWLALDDAPEGAGCLEVVPRSHLRGLATPHGGVIPEEICARDRAGERAVLLPARAGELILLHNHLWHRSAQNLGGRQRRALTVCLLAADVRCTRRKNPRQFVRLFEGLQAGAPQGR
jgi:phytanoyl-CoA hydroxylase